MQSPYTPHQLDALMVAETSVGLALTALVWARPLGTRLASLLLVLSTWIAVVQPVDAEFLQGLGVTLSPTHAQFVLRTAIVLGGLASLLSLRAKVAVPGVLGAVFLFWARNQIQNSDWDVAGAVLAYLGVVVGLAYHSGPRPPVRAREAASTTELGFFEDDVGLFVLATTLAALVSTFVLERHTNSGDEWADTYQAAVFLKGHAFAGVPKCAEAFRSYWVYQYEGRSFAQYTPGWPLFMAPFVGLGLVWLASPVALGLLAVGVARVARRAVAGCGTGDLPGDREQVRVAGVLGGLAVTLGSTMLINGGARYPHVFVAAMFAWSVEGVLALTVPGQSKRSQWLVGGALGSTLALGVSARPADGMTLATGIAVYFLYALARRRIGRDAFLATATLFAFWAGLTLVILRLQLGVWFHTGYSITERYYSWNKLNFSLPKPDEIRASIPLASGSYCWWPASPALGLAGLFALRGRARAVTAIMLASFIPFLTFYTLFEIGRHGDAGYGPRYEFPCVVPMAVGTGVILSGLVVRARAVSPWSGGLRAGGPAAVVLVAVVLGIVRLFPLIYPANFSDARDHNRLQNALAKRTDIHDAVVLGMEGVSSVDTLDLTENYPPDLYPRQDVLIARGDVADAEKCVRESFPGRRIYTARMKDGQVQIEPGPPK